MKEVLRAHDRLHIGLDLAICGDAARNGGGEISLIGVISSGGVASLVIEPSRNAVRRGDAADDFRHAAFGEIAGFWSQRPHRSQDLRGLRDDIECRTRLEFCR